MSVFSGTRIIDLDRELALLYRRALPLYLYISFIQHGASIDGLSHLTFNEGIQIVSIKAKTVYTCSVRRANRVLSKSIPAVVERDYVSL